MRLMGLVGSRLLWLSTSGSFRDRRRIPAHFGPTHDRWSIVNTWNVDRGLRYLLGPEFRCVSVSPESSFVGHMLYLD